MWANLEIDRVDPDDAGRVLYRLSGALSYGDPGAQFVTSIKNDLEAGHTDIVLDLGKLGRIDSGGIGLLCAAHSSVRNAGGSLRLEGLNERYHKLFKSVGLAAVFDIA